MFEDGDALHAEHNQGTHQKIESVKSIFNGRNVFYAWSHVKHLDLKTPEEV